VIYRTRAIFIFVILLVSLFAPFLISPPAVHAFPDNCGLHPSNLFRNGSMAPGHQTQFGEVAQDWQPFVLNGSPRFEWVDNEKWDANGAQYFWSDSVAFDAGIFQSVGGLQPGVFYRFRIGYSHARLDPGNAQNEVHPSMGRQVGVDPTGGTDPKSPNVMWGPSLFNSDAGMNPPQLTMTFAARADKATMYFRGIFNGGGGRAKIWFDVACMEPLFDLPTATPLAPTATPMPPTNPPRPAATRAPSTPTKIAPAPTSTPPPTETREPATATPTNTLAPAALRYARPDVTPTAGLSIDWGMGIVAGAGLLFIVGALGFFGIGYLLWSRHR